MTRKQQRLKLLTGNFLPRKGPPWAPSLISLCFSKNSFSRTLLVPLIEKPIYFLFWDFCFPSDQAVPWVKKGFVGPFGTTRQILTKLDINLHIDADIPKLLVHECKKILNDPPRAQSLTFRITDTCGQEFRIHRTQHWRFSLSLPWITSHPSNWQVSAKAKLLSLFLSIS